MPGRYDWQHACKLMLYGLSLTRNMAKEAVGLRNGILHYVNTTPLRPYVPSMDDMEARDWEIMTSDDKYKEIFAPIIITELVDKDNNWVLRFNKPLTLDVFYDSDEQRLCASKYDLQVTSYGDSREELVNEVADRLLWLWESYVVNKYDHPMTSRADDLIRTYKGMVTVYDLKNPYDEVVNVLLNLPEVERQGPPVFQQLEWLTKGAWVHRTEFPDEVEWKMAWENHYTGNVITVFTDEEDSKDYVDVIVALRTSKTNETQYTFTIPKVTLTQDLCKILELISSRGYSKKGGYDDSVSEDM
jgi:hypothetical protein